MKLALIPARGGSKRIPRKNIKNFYGKPLIAYSIEIAKKSTLFDRIIVSTDDAEIAEIAKAYGAEVPFVRPTSLSDDFATTKDVIEHTLDFLVKSGEECQYLCTIYATAPFLKSEFLVEGFNKLRKSSAINAFSCTSMPFPIQRTFKITQDNRCEMFWPENFAKRSQDLEESYQDAGQFYWNKIVTSNNENDILFGQKSIPVVIPRHFVQDIDTLEDWKRAEFMFRALKESGEL